jgi:hypothetical protein
MLANLNKADGVQNAAPAPKKGNAASALLAQFAGAPPPAPAPRKVDPHVQSNVASLLSMLTGGAPKPAPAAAPASAPAVSSGATAAQQSAQLSAQQSLNFLKHDKNKDVEAMLAGLNKHQAPRSAPKPKRNSNHAWGGTSTRKHVINDAWGNGVSSGTPPPTPVQNFEKEWNGKTHDSSSCMSTLIRAKETELTSGGVQPMLAHFSALKAISAKYPKGCGDVNIHDPHNPCTLEDLDKYYFAHGKKGFYGHFTAAAQFKKKDGCSILKTNKSGPTPAPTTPCSRAQKIYWLRGKGVARMKAEILVDEGMEYILKEYGGKKEDYCAQLPTPTPTAYPTMYPTDPTPSPTQPPSVIAAQKAKKAELAKQMKKAAKQGVAQSSQSNVQLLLLAVLSSVLMAYSCIALRTLGKTLVSALSSKDTGGEDFSHGEEMSLNSSKGSYAEDKGNSRYQTGYTPAQVAEPEEEEEEEEEEENQYAWQRSAKPKTDAKSSYYSSEPAQSTNDYSAEYDNDDDYGEYNADVI